VIAPDEYGKTFLLSAKGDREEVGPYCFFRECNLDLPRFRKMNTDKKEEQPK
jgi:hypothetical protein